MVLHVVTMVTMLVSVGNALNCYHDVYLDNVTEHTYTIDHDIADIGDGIGNTASGEDGYWRTRHFDYITLGRFTDDLESGDGSTITGGYYTADGDLIYSTTVDCDANKYYNYVTDEETGTITEIENGDLETPCAAGDEFDMWLKVEQPQTMWFNYQAQSLQTGTRTAQRGNQFKWEKEVLSRINTKYDSDTASYFKISTTGSAVITRFAFGKCFIWPDSVGTNCTDTIDWLMERGKLAGRMRGVQEVHFTMSCLDSPFQHYYAYRQEAVHPDRLAKYFTCCCVDMRTGHVWDDDSDTYCAAMNPTCPLGCSESYDNEIYQAVVDYHTASEVAAEQEVAEEV